MGERQGRLPTTGASAADEREWLPFEGLRREIDNLFEGFRPFGRSALGRSLAETRHDFTIMPAFDFAEKDGGCEVMAELPGMDDKNIDIRLTNHTLIVKGEKSEAKEEGDKKSSHLSERRFGSFQRSFELPEGIDQERVEAQFAKGIVTIRFPKTLEAQRAERRISTKAV